DHQHQRALAAAGGTDDRNELAGGDVEADLLQRAERRVAVLAEGLRNAADADRDTRFDVDRSLVDHVAHDFAPDAVTPARGTFERRTPFSPGCPSPSS